MVAKEDVAEATQQVIPGLGMLDAELFDTMGGIAQVQSVDNRLYTAEWAKTVAAMPRVPVYVAGDHPEWLQINGMTFIVAPEQIVMVPRVVKEGLDNKRAMLKSVEDTQKRLKKAMSPGSINDIPEYIG